MKMLSTVLFAVLVAVASAQRLNYGDCKNIPVKAPFDVSKYTGVWYEIEKNPVPFEANQKCISALYEDKGDYVYVKNMGVNENTGKETFIEGKATIPDPNEPAKLKVKFNMPFSANYWVLDTDYEKYSVVYSCYSVLKIFNIEYLWILSRDKTLDDSTKQNLYALLDKNEIKRDTLKPTVQDCA